MKTLNEINQSSFEKFNELPDAAYVRLVVVLSLLSCSRATLWRWIKSDRFIAPTKIGERNIAWNVGDLRSALRKLSMQKID